VSQDNGLMDFTIVALVAMFLVYMYFNDKDDNNKYG